MIFKNKEVVSDFSCKPFNMSLGHGDTRGSLENRKSFLGALGIDHKDLVCAGQVHGANIALAESSDKGRGALSKEASFDSTDALITKDKNVPIAVFTADCLSVFLFDPKTPAIGLVHAGWKGTKEKITTKAVLLMKKEFGSDPGSMRAGFGPSMRGCCLEVGKDFKSFFSRGISTREGKLYLDLVGINREELVECGIPENNIVDSMMCTSCDNAQFYSFRKDGASCGRIMSVIMLR